MTFDWMNSALTEVSLIVAVAELHRFFARRCKSILDRGRLVFIDKA